MKYFLVVLLTLITFSCILIVANKFTKKSYSKKIYRQSDMHEMLKRFFLNGLSVEVKSSQMMKRKEKLLTRVIILEDKAYWVVDNVFYVGDAVNGSVQPESGEPISTSGLSSKEINKLLFILDNLKNGKTNDSGSAGD
jgi:hypothetical protein